MTAGVADTFATMLRRHRLMAGLSQEALAERAGLSASAVASLERGRRTSPRSGTIALLAAALGLTPVDRAALIVAGAREQRGDAAPTVSTPNAEPPAMYPPLPSTPTMLFGREHETAAVVHLLVTEGSSRFVTLIGPGGVGKTRLALAVAAALPATFTDGIAFVDLSTLRDPALVGQAVAQVVGVRDDGARDLRELLIASLGARKLVLVLDNFEQVVEAATLVAALVAACPHLAVLVTSRIALQVRAEQRFVVAPLAVPDPGHYHVEEVEHCAAVRLFTARARAVEPDFHLRADNVAAIATLCRRLDGLPLAIELAAARIGVLPPTELLGRLQRRLDVLKQQARDVPARQQTLRATIDWSHALLTPEEQALFRRAGVFAGGAMLVAIEAICDPDGSLDVLGSVASLIDKSLLRAERGDKPRITMLETLHDYAAERLEEAGETDSLRRAHAAYYLAHAEAAEPELRGARQAMSLRLLTDEHDNLRAALHWALQQDDIALGWRLGRALWRFWYLQGHIGEGRHWLARLLELAGGDVHRDLALARAAMLGGAGVFAELQGDYSAARALHEESLAIRQHDGDTWGVADSLDDLGVLADSQGDFARATALYEQSLQLFGALGDAWGTALVLGNMGYLAREQGAYARAAASHEQSLALFREVGDTRNIAFTLNNLAEVLCDQGDYGRAWNQCTESLALRRTLGDTWGIAISLGTLSRVACAQGEFGQATALSEESLALFRTLGATWNTACTLDSLSIVARAQGALEQAAEYAEQSLALFRRIHDAKGIARALSSAAQVARDHGDMARAERLYRESLALYRDVGVRGVGVAVSLEGLAQVLSIPDDAPASPARRERGVRLWAAVDILRNHLGTPRSPADSAAYNASIGAARAALGEETFAAAWATGAGLSLEQALAEALQHGSP